MPGSETEQHQRLKHLALRWAMEQGYTCGAMEISLPRCGYRADVAAYKPSRRTMEIEFEGRMLRQSQSVIGSTAVFECKQSRPDMLKDSIRTDKTRERLKQLNDRRLVLERLLKVHYPHAGNGDSLFQEFQSYNLEAAGHKGYQMLLRKISVLQNGLFQKTKFEKMTRYRCASLFYLVTTGEILSDFEIPLQWGWLVEAGDRLQLKQKPFRQEASDGDRLAVLQKIAEKGFRSGVQLIDISRK